MITRDQFKEILNFKSDEECDKWYEPLTHIIDVYDINTPQRIAAFLAQTGHESNNFTALSENLNYSADGLVKTFKKYFPTIESTTGYARNPQKIANKVYANRMGNGDESSGDGWMYRGAGLIQLTGHDNQSKFAEITKKQLSAICDYLRTPEGALHSAAWFWSTHGCNELADTNDTVAITKVINGGDIGLADREARYERAILILLT